MKTVYILRGLPGSGKSTFAQKLTSDGGGVIYSADNFFIKDGVYKFDGDRIRDAHAESKALFLVGLDRGWEVIVVDNTNTQYWEYQFYKDWAEKSGYRVVVITVGELTDAACEEYVLRNSHGVPRDKIFQMRNRWEK